MNVTGVIVEYNPLHNGHLYHLQQSKKQTKADLMIAVMSGDFLQRGEPALLSKWERTQLALKAGVDLVLELPYAFATQHAELFASGAISILAACGVTHVCFGSELGQIEPFYKTIQAFDDQEKKQAFERAIKSNLDIGMSYPRAASLAFQSLDLTEQTIDLSQPNNILGYHYVKAIIEQKAPIQAETIQRTAAQYHDPKVNPEASIASATSIRNHLFYDKNETDDISHFVPSFTVERLKQSAELKRLASWETFFPFLKYQILTSLAGELEAIYEAEEGLENRVIKVMQKASTFKAFMSELKTKRYTWTRLQRLCTHILTKTTKDDMSFTLHTKRAEYIRLLGMSQKGQAYLNEKKGAFGLPLITNINKKQAALLSLDIKASGIYDWVTTGKSSQEFKATPIRMY